MTTTTVVVAVRMPTAVPMDGHGEAIGRSQPDPTPPGRRRSGPVVTTVRRVRFEYPDDADPIWTPSRPEFACAANSVSLMMPTIEPYFVRSARSAIEHLDDDELARTARHYVAQETQHHRQHVRYNRLLIARYRGLGRLDRLIRSVYRRLEQRASDRFNLAFAAASETMAYSAARWAAEHRQELFADADDRAATLFLWHLAEEVEHKSVAFDLYRHRHGHEQGAGRTHGLAAVLAVMLVTSFVFIGTTVLLAGARRLHHPMAWWRLTGWAVGFGFELVTNLVVSVLPGHHPSRMADPLWYEVWLREFDSSTGTLPIWHGRTEPDCVPEADRDSVTTGVEPSTDTA